MATMRRSMVVMICCVAMMMMLLATPYASARPLKARTAPLAAAAAMSADAPLSPAMFIHATTAISTEIDEASALPAEVDEVAVAAELASHRRTRIQSLAGAFEGVEGSGTTTTPNGLNGVAFTSTIYKQCVDNSGWGTGLDSDNVWVYAQSDTLITGMYRSGGGSSSNDNGLHNLESVQSCSIQGVNSMPFASAVDGNWYDSFNGAGWSYCPANTYLFGLYRGGCDALHCLEYVKCNAPNPALTSGYNDCQEYGIGLAFDNGGWVNCPKDYFITGLYRSGADLLYGIETMNCCKPKMYTLGWRVGNWSTCTGTQTRTVACYNSANVTIADSYCPATMRPISVQSCVVPLGPADIWSWRAGNWSTCNQTLCGLQYKYRTAACYNGLNALGNDTRCNGTKPSTVQSCGDDSADCPTDRIVTGAWGACSATCGNGTQTRLVYWANTGRAVVGDKTYPNIQTCNYGACIVYVYTWSYTDYGYCSATCGTGTKTRWASCRDQFGVETAAYELCGVRDATEIVCQDAECIYYPVTSDWSECSATCGGGVKTRTSICGYPLCYNVTLVMECDIVRCPVYSWNVSDWSECLPCGQGMQTRTATCVPDMSTVSIDTTGIQCLDRQGAISLSQSCTSDDTCKSKMAAWAYGPWGTCSKTCGTGIQSRAVWCPTPTYGCSGTQWNTNKRCNTNSCPGYGWKIGAWGQCSSPCSNIVGYATRSVVCMGTDGSIVAEAACRANSSFPGRTGRCYSSKTCASLGYDWVTSDWSSCSTASTCGVGVRTRTVACSGPTEEYCSCGTKPSTADVCTTECESSDAVWTLSEYSECTATCGQSGVQIATISCLTTDGVPADVSICEAKQSYSSFLAAHPTATKCVTVCH